MPRLFRLHTVPGRIRTLTAFAVVALLGLFAVTGVALLQARAGLRAVGNDEGPAMDAGSNLYLALSDMDAQVTNVLLTGRENDWLCEPEQVGAQLTRPGGETCDRAQPRVYYEIRREDASRAALQAAELAGDDLVQLGTVLNVLDGLHQYDQRVQAAMEIARQTEHPVGVPPQAAVERYRAATMLMTEDLLPKAYNLSLAHAARVNAIYQDRRAATVSGRTWVLGTGLLAVGLLAILQIYLAGRFKRVINPWLVVATVGTVALTMTSASLLSTEAKYLRTAKTGGFDPVLTLSRTRAFAKILDADRNRYLIDPQDADRYDQMYLDRAQTILYIRGANSMDVYYTKLDQRFEHNDGDSRAVGFGGFYGTQTRAISAGGGRDLLGALLLDYRTYQANDRRVRALARAGKRGAAAQAHIDPNPELSDLPHPGFREHDEGLAALIARHRYVRDRAVFDGKRALATWMWVLSGSIAIIAGLLVFGVRPRLNEFR
jgi:hypothetical protein